MGDLGYVPSPSPVAVGDANFEGHLVGPNNDWYYAGTGERYSQRIELDIH